MKSSIRKLLLTRTNIVQIPNKSLYMVQLCIPWSVAYQTDARYQF